MGVKGFPTLKIVRPGKKAGRPVVEDYNGGRTAGAITEAVVQKINNHVTRATDKDLDAFLAKGDGAKAILFTDKGTTSALLRSVAIDYLGVIGVAQVRNKETASVAKYSIEKFPTLVLIPGEGQEPITYEGEMKKAAIVKFLSQAGEPNPDPAPAKAKGDKKQKKSKPKAEKAEKPPKADKESQAPEDAAETADEVPPAASTPAVIPITIASSKQEVDDKCLQPKSHTCILALIQNPEDEVSQKAVNSLSQLNTKYIHGKRQMFPFFAIPDSVEDLSFIREKLESSGKVELVAMNARRGWWRKYEGDFDAASVEAWVDVIRMGEGTKMKLPSGVVSAAQESEAAPKASEEAAAEEPATEESPVEEDAQDHDEL